MPAILITFVDNGSVMCSRPYIVSPQPNQTRTHLGINNVPQPLPNASCHIALFSFSRLFFIFPKVPPLIGGIHWRLDWGLYYNTHNNAKLNTTHNNNQAFHEYNTIHGLPRYCLCHVPTGSTFNSFLDMDG